LQGTVGDFSVLENFRMAWLRGSRFSIVCSSGRKFREQLRQYLSSKGRGFEELLDREIASLSGGQRQVLTVLMNLFNEPSVLLLDEPTAALDAAMSEILLELLQLANQEKGITMVMITHDLHAAIHSGNRLLIMKDGLLEKELTGKEKEELSAESLFGKLNPSNRA